MSNMINMKGGVNKMCESGLGYAHGGRNFLTKEEKIEMLKEYKENLDQELMGVAERIKDMESEK